MAAPYSISAPFVSFVTDSVAPSPSSPPPPPPLRFQVGRHVMCNLGPGGWQLGRVVALHYREESWPAEQESAPYQVALEADHDLIYVPADDGRCCRAATSEDLRIARRADALAPLPPGMLEEEGADGTNTAAAVLASGGNGAHPQQQQQHLGCGDGTSSSPSGGGVPGGYRSGLCYCCERCPRHWSCAELYSEHYRCAERHGLRVTLWPRGETHDLGTLRVGDTLLFHPKSEEFQVVREDPGAGGTAGSTSSNGASTSTNSNGTSTSTSSGGGGDGGNEKKEGLAGFLQCPTLARLPPGVAFADDGSLVGRLQFDPRRPSAYDVAFVAVSTARWDDPTFGIARLEVSFTVEGNEPPPPPPPGEEKGIPRAGVFDGDAFGREQQHARAAARQSLRRLEGTWDRWEQDRSYSNRDTW